MPMPACTMLPAFSSPQVAHPIDYPIRGEQIVLPILLDGRRSSMEVELALPRDPAHLLTRGRPGGPHPVNISTGILKAHGEHRIRAQAHPAEREARRAQPQPSAPHFQSPALKGTTPEPLPPRMWPPPMPWPWPWPMWWP